MPYSLTAQNAGANALTHYLSNSPTESRGLLPWQSLDISRPQKHAALLQQSQLFRRIADGVVLRIVGPHEMLAAQDVEHLRIARLPSIRNALAKRSACLESTSLRPTHT